MKPQLQKLVQTQLEQRARRLLETRKPYIIAIGGSVGKTTTREAVAAVLREHYGKKVLVAAENYNTHIAVPLALFGLTVPERISNVPAWFGLFREMDALLQAYPYDVVVLELGADKPGDITHFLSYLTPDIGIVTAVAPEHMEYFGTLEAVFAEEFALAQGSRTVIVNASYPKLLAAAERLRKPLISYGAGGEVHWKNSGVVALGGKSLKLPSSLLGEHARSGVLAAAAVAQCLGISTKALQKGIAGLQPYPGRMQRLQGKRGSVLIDDTYNASPESALPALQVLSSEPGKRKIAILGSMNEMGDYAKKAHTKVGEACGELDVLVTVGDMAERWLAPAARKAGLSQERIHSFASPYAAGIFVRGLLGKGDVVLAKGSQNGVYCEEALKLLLAKPTDATKLVRQSSAWIARKQKQFKDFRLAKALTKSIQ